MSKKSGNIIILAIIVQAILTGLLNKASLPSFIFVSMTNIADIALWGLLFWMILYLKDKNCLLAVKQAAFLTIITGIVGTLTDVCFLTIFMNCSFGVIAVIYELETSICLILLLYYSYIRGNDVENNVNTKIQIAATGIVFVTMMLISYFVLLELNPVSTSLFDEAAMIDNSVLINLLVHGTYGLTGIAYTSYCKMATK